MTRPRRTAAAFLSPALLGLADDAALVAEMEALTDAELDARIASLRRTIADAGGDGVWLAHAARIEALHSERETRALTEAERREVQQLLAVLRETA